MINLKFYRCDFCGQETVCLFVSPRGYGDLCEACYYAGSELLQRASEKQLIAIKEAIDLVYGAKA